MIHGQIKTKWSSVLKSLNHACRNVWPTELNFFDKLLLFFLYFIENDFYLFTIS